MSDMQPDLRSPEQKRHDEPIKCLKDIARANQAVADELAIMRDEIETAIRKGWSR